MTNWEHDQQRAMYTQKLNELSGEGLLMTAVGMLILNGKTSKYELTPQDAATVEQLLRRADPSFSW